MFTWSSFRLNRVACFKQENQNQWHNASNRAKPSPSEDGLLSRRCFAMKRTPVRLSSSVSLAIFMFLSVQTSFGQDGGAGPAPQAPANSGGQRGAQPNNPVPGQTGTQPRDPRLNEPEPRPIFLSGQVK